jgi:hypothetical protein
LVGYATQDGGGLEIADFMRLREEIINDAHGQGKLAIKPKARHAELVVNLAGAMASFLVSTWDERQRDW